ncbi:hypothetical protein KC316_g6320 [Hortaea werneckii]|nr:hypothetical protein KC324_g6324 [Hortaea werneckii]KAI7585133.1 hypothetical protein KC316_g6320 [Hortaea werneckii]
MDEFSTGPLEPPSQMQLAKLPLYCLDRKDLSIRTTSRRPEHGDTAWREMCLRVKLHKEQNRDRISLKIATTIVGERMRSALATLKSAGERSNLTDSESAAAIVDFLLEMLWLAVDQLGTCLARNGNFLWQLAQRYVDGFKPSKLGFAREFYQISFRMVGLKRRLQSIAKAVMVIQNNELVRSHVSEEPSGSWRRKQIQIVERMTPLENKIEYIMQSFQELNSMRINVTSSDQADAANNLALSGRVIAFATLAYNPASIAVGVFGMDLGFIKRMSGKGFCQFFLTLGLLYAPVVLLLLVTWLLRYFRRMALNRREVAGMTNKAIRRAEQGGDQWQGHPSKTGE